MRIIFCGTPDFAVPSLRRVLSEPDFDVLAIVTQPDRPRGRGQHFASTPVKEVALKAGISVFQPASLKTAEVRGFFATHSPDAVVIIAYGRIVPPDLLSIPRLGWINLHASLLPRYRGAAPIQWAIINGETRTGVTTMQIDAGLDTGPILDQVEMEIGSDESAPDLSARMADVGATLLIRSLRDLQTENIIPHPQDSAKASFAPPLKKQDGKIFWDLSAAQIYNRIRGLQPWPGAYCSFRGHACHVWGRPAPEIASMNAASTAPLGTIVPQDGDYFVVCGAETRLRLETLQMEGRKRVSAREFANGARFQPGDRFA
jgi:methionyl-tRNA formyltransferase